MNRETEDPLLPWGWTIGLAAVALLLRAAFASQTVYHWDGVQFAMALRQFDVRLHQPHPPGYFYYVLGADLATLWTGDPARGMALLSGLFGALATGLLYRMGREVGGEAVGRVAGLLSLTAPILLFYGAVQLTYSVDLFGSTLTAFFCFRLARGPVQRRDLIAVGATYGVAGGVRPTTLLFLAPIVLLGLWRARRDLPGVALSLGVAAALTLGWLIPVVALSGDWQGYLGALKDERHVLSGTSLWQAGGGALRESLVQHARSVTACLGVALPVAMAAAYRRLRHRRAADRTDPSDSPAVVGCRSSLVVGRLLTLWIVPAALFFAVVHFPSPGYALTYAGALLLGAAIAIEWLCRGLPSAIPREVAPGVIALLNLGLFCNVPRIVPPDALGHGALVWDEIRSHDAYWSEFPTIVGSAAPPGEILILTSPTFTEGLRMAQYYLPEYRADIRQPLAPRPGRPLPELVRRGVLPIISPADALADPRPKICVTRTALDVAYFRHLFGDAFTTSREGSITVGRLAPGVRR